MKALFRTLIATTATVVALVSCTKEVNNEIPATTKQTVSFKFYANPAGVGTRATLTPNADETSFAAAWEDGETMDFAAFCDDPSFDELGYATWSSQDEAFTAEFSDVVIPEGNHDWLYYAYYPAKESIPFGSPRTQQGNTYNSLYDVMYGETDVITGELGKDASGDPVVVPMSRLTGIAYFHITGGPNENVVSATLSAEGIAAESVNIDYVGTAPGLEIPNEVTRLNEITINFAEGTAPKATDFQLWFNVIPGSYSNLKLTVVTESQIAILAPSGTATYTAGRLNKAVLNNLPWRVAEYQKVTSSDNLTNGQYLIVYEDGNVAFDGSLETLDAASNTIEVVIQDNKIVPDSDVHASAFTLNVDKGTILSSSQYYIGRTGDSNGMNTSQVDKYLNNISIDQDGNAVIVSSGGAYLRYNSDSGQERFRYFKSATYAGQKVVALYKLSAGAAPDNRTPVTLSFTPAEPEAITVGDEFTEPTLTVDPVDAASLVTYSVSTEPEGIASVASNGELTITGAGTITVTASIADGNETYKPATASYILTVNPMIGHGESAEDPYTVAEALAIIDALETVGTDGRTETRYVSGIISQVISYNSDYRSITYSITADGQPSSAYIQVYSGKGLNGANFSSINDLSVGDEVIVAGSLMKYQSGSDIIPEIYQNSQIVSLVKAPYFTATASPQTFESEGGNATLSVKANVPWTATINNGGSLKIGDANASTSVSGTNDTEVTVIIPENAEGATYTISFTTTSDKVTAPDPIQITQNAYVDLVEATATFTGKKSGGMTAASVGNETSGTRRNVTATITSGGKTDDDIRVYKGANLTFEVPSGAYITKIEFTGTSSNPVSGFADQNGFTKSGNNGIWSGSSQSVAFTASGAQVRLTRIDVTYRIAEEDLITYVPAINVTSANPMSVENSAGSQTITYAIDEAPDGATLTGVTKNEGANWISNIVYSTSGTVTFDVAAQETGAQARSATLTLKYTGATDVPVTVNQAAGPSLGESTSTLTFTAKCNGSGTADDGVEWTVTSDGTESTFDSTRGIHYGTNNAAVKYIRLSTSGISGTITKVVVNASAASSATVDVKVGGSAFGGDPKPLSTSAANYTFEGSASGEIVVTVTKPASANKALYVKSIAVTYNNN